MTRGTDSESAARRRGDGTKVILTNLDAFEEKKEALHASLEDLVAQKYHAGRDQATPSTTCQTHSTTQSVRVDITKDIVRHQGLGTAFQSAVNKTSVPIGQYKMLLSQRLFQPDWHRMKGTRKHLSNCVTEYARRQHR
jgi:hypothetical protein